MRSRAHSENLTHYHSSLLISLSIFRSLATECRRDIALLSPSLIGSVDSVLASVPSDMEVVARAASVVRHISKCYRGRTDINHSSLHGRRTRMDTSLERIA